MAVDFMVHKSHEFTSKIEFVGYLTGSGDAHLDRFSVPSILGVNSDQRDLLDKLIQFSGSTEVMLASDLDLSLEESLGIRISHLDNDEVESARFFSSRVLVTPGAQGLSSYPSAFDRSRYFQSARQEDLDDALLAKVVREQGVPMTLITRLDSERPIRNNIRRFFYLPWSIDIGQFGTRNSYYPNLQFLRLLLSPDLNRFDSGLSYGDIHIHESSTRKRATPEQRDMMDAIDEDYYRLPSAYDFVSFYCSHQRMNKLGLDTQCVVRGIVALTDEEDPARRELLGTSFLDTRAVTDDPRTEKEIMGRAERANETKSFEDVKHYFDMIKTMVTEGMPDFVDVSISPKT